MTLGGGTVWEVNSMMYVASVRLGCVLPFHTITADSVPHVRIGLCQSESRVFAFTHVNNSNSYCS